ncbi:MAG: ABC transporter permease [Lentisphaeria bacterium]|nr:ABC transporter permease [Lentisphaeria bacterium]MBR3688366.1 ABC transporter permease [Lentisphaeria bacterium]
MQAIKNIFQLGKKEILSLCRDGLLMALIVYSFSAALIVSYNASTDFADAAIAVVDEDQSQLTQRVTDAFLPPLFLPVDIIQRADIDRTMDEGRYTFVIVFPVDFEKDVMANMCPEVQVNVDATRMSQAFTGAGYIQQILTNAVSDFVRDSTGTSSPLPANMVIRNRYNPNLDSAWFMALMQLANNIAMLAIILTGSALLTEREKGTLEHLLVMPVTPFQIMVSKIWSMMLVVMVAALTGLFLVVRMYLQIPLAGSYVLFALGMAVYLFALTSLGIFLACMSQNMPQLGLLIILVLMPLEMLSGSATPQESMPVWVQRVMQFAPTTHFVNITQGILFRGAGLRAMWPTFLKLFLIGAGLFTLSLSRFRKSVA